MPSTISAGTTAGTAIAIAGDTTGNLAFQTNGTTTAMTIDTSQRVGIGTTTPSSNLVVNGTTATQFDLLTNGTRYFTAYTDATQVILGGIQNTIFSFRQNDVERMQLDTSGNLRFNSGYGSVATAYGTRAWVNFVGSSGAINSSGGVSSVTRNGTGDYSVNFSFTFPDANYAGTGMGRRNSSAQRAVLMVMNNTATYNQFTTYARFYTMLNDSATVEDPIFFNYTAVR